MLTKERASAKPAGGTVRSKRQESLQHPDIAFTQGVDEGRGIRTAVKHLAAFGIQ